jgi:hypothetical protein
LEKLKQGLLTVFGDTFLMQMVEGFVEYKRREFCNDVKCSVQVELNRLVEGSEVYEKKRKQCSNGCLFSTYQFHHWLIEKGYLIIRNQEGKQTVLATLDKKLADWMDKQVQCGKFKDKNGVIEAALTDYRKTDKPRQNKAGNKN